VVAFFDIYRYAQLDDKSSSLERREEIYDLIIVYAAFFLLAIMSAYESIE